VKKKKNVAKAEAGLLLITIASLIFCGVFAQLSFVKAPSGSTFGNTAVGRQSYTFSNYKDASRFQLSAGGTIQTVSVYFSNSRFFAKAAVYADAGAVPGALIAQSGSMYVKSSGWMTFSVTQKALSLGTYWLAIETDSSKAQLRISYSGSSVQHVKRYSANYGAEFTSYFGSLSSSDSGLVSIYASYLPSVQPTPSPNPTPSLSLAPTLTPTVAPTLTPSTSPTLAPASTVKPSPTISSTLTATPIPTSSPSPAAKIAIYSSVSCVTALSSINWGQLTPGTTQSMTVYVRNEGNAAATLSKSLTNWSPSSLESYLSLDWNYGGQSLATSAVVAVALKLTVLATTPAMASFGFDTVITGTSS
jgi:hypothetical protein